MALRTRIGLQDVRALGTNEWVRDTGVRRNACHCAGGGPSHLAYCTTIGPTSPTEPNAQGEPMSTTITVMYENTADATFNLDYYLKNTCRLWARNSNPTASKAGGW